MVNDPLMESERNIEARQSKLTRKDAAPKFAMNNDIQEMQQANQFKKTRKITGVSKIDNRIRIGLSKIKSPGFFKRGKKGNIDEAVSPIVDVRKGGSQFATQAALLTVPFGKVGSIARKSASIFPSKKSIQQFIRTKVVKGEKIDPNVATAIVIKDPDAFKKFQATYKPSAQQIKTTEGGLIKVFQEKTPIIKPDSNIAYNVIGTRTRPMISRDIGEEALTTIGPGTTGIPFGTRVTAAPLPPKPLSKTTIGVLGTGTFGVGAAPIIPSLIPQSKTTTLPTRPMISVDTMEETLTKPITTTTTSPQTRPMISRDPLEEDLSIPSITTPDIKIPEPTIPEPSIPNITIPEIKIPEPKVPSITVPSTDIPTPQTIDQPIITDEEIDFDIPISTSTPTPTPTPTPTIITTSTPTRTPDAPPPTTPPPTTPPPPPSQTVRGDRTRKRFRSRRSRNKSDFDKRKSAALPYPSKVQYKEKDKYVTFNLNTNKKKVFNTPQGIGVNPGTTPEDTLKVIQKQKTKPKFKKYKLGNLVLSVTSPETIVIRRLRAFKNNKTNKRFRR